MKRHFGLAALVFVVGCATSQAGPGDDAGITPPADARPPAIDAAVGADFWEDCVEHTDCEDGLCYYANPDDETGHCTEECDGLCPDGFACRLVEISPGTDLRICVPADETFCQPCDTNQECGDSSDFCVSLTAGYFCTIDCADNASVCPVGFTCQQVSGAGDTVTGKQCMPLNGVCCIDADGDLRGEGGGCVTTDCDDDNAAVYDDAVEVCDGFDNDCVGGIDVDPTDCAHALCQLGALGYFERAAEPCTDADCVEQSAVLCDLYTCDGGGEDGDACATSCDGEDDAKCIPTAHCDDSVCYSDFDNGQACDESSDCVSGHCQNGFCCSGTGDCCQVASDCPTYGTVAPICDDTTTCQGTRGEAVCTASFTCASTGVEQDDSACLDTTLADDCDWYLDIYCTGAVTQPAPTCPTSCSNHSQCDPPGHCDPTSHTCIEDLENGQFCDDDDARCKSGHCQNGFCCDDGDCCHDEGDCPAGYSSDPECTVPSACQGDRDVAQCVDSECSTSVGVDDDSACTDSVLADNCGSYLPIYCDGNSVQPAPECPDSCVSDLDCDLDAYCNMDSFTCIPDEPNGHTCDDKDECQSDHCDNGFCCATGVCCANSDDCNAMDEVSECNNSTTCQGTRVDGVCGGNFQCSAQTVDDDSGCAGLEADDCGPYPATHCTSAVDQAAPVCTNTCGGDGECDPSAHCDGGQCQPDEGQGGYCDELSDCTSGLYCVDNVCCNSSCTGSCRACDLAGHVGTCSNVPSGQDPDEECGAVSCGSYFWGWGGDNCYNRADVSAANAMCNGNGACRSAAVECGASSQGPVYRTCDSFCQDPTGGTCVGTTAGTCTNLNQGSETCGYGVCQVTMPRCLSGVPNPCTPNTGAATTETCNNIDDNCDNIIDNGAFSDSSEPNGGCTNYTTLSTVGSNQTLSVNTKTIYGYGDNDYYRINASETDSSCSCCDFFCTDEDYRLTVTLNVPVGAGSYIFCTGSSCGDVDTYCQEILAGSSNGWVYILDGGCPGNDDYSRYFHIYGDNAPGYECLPYTLSYHFETGCSDDW